MIGMSHGFGDSATGSAEDVTIWIRNYAGGEAIWDVIQEFWRERNVAGVPMVDAAT